VPRPQLSRAKSFRQKALGGCEGGQEESCEEGSEEAREEGREEGGQEESGQEESQVVLAAAPGAAENFV
jgi:hypothetical protein